MRELVAEQERSAPAARPGLLTEESKSELPSIIEDHVGEQIQKLEGRFLSGLRQPGEKAGEEKTAVLNEQLSVSPITIEKTLSGAAPAFLLEALRYSTSLIEPRTEVIQGALTEADESKSRHGFCPNCASTNIRRAHKHGMFEEFLRLFFIAPFRCRTCRHTFYRF